MSRRVVVVVLVGLVGATALLLVARGASVRTARAGGERANSAALQAFAVFRGDGAADSVQVDKIVRELPGGAVDPATARRAIATAEYAVHVIGGPAHLCLAVREAGGSGSLGCADPEMTASGDRPLIALDFLGGGRWRVTGLAPDGTTDLSLATADGRRTELTLRQNIFSAATATTPESLDFRSPAGVTRHLAFAALGR